MRIIFCDSGFDPKEIDYMYVEEYNSAKKENISISLISFEELKRDNFKSSIKRVKESEIEEMGIYRGWMLKPNQYEKLYEELLTKNIRLINNPQEYKFCHYLPQWYESLKSFTPKTTYKELNEEFDINKYQQELNEFEDKPIIVKDYVKSQKHYWNEACYIPNPRDKEKTKRVIEKFIELQGEDINEGLVFREYVELEKLTNHSISGMPLTKEYRVFVLRGELISTYNYWDEGDYEGVIPKFEQFEGLIKQIRSKFYTIDIARKKNGEWIIMELGDGQVSGLPENANKEEFYKEIKRIACA